MTEPKTKDITENQREMIFSLLFLRHQIGNLKKETSEINIARAHALDIVGKALNMKIQENEKNTIKPSEKINSLEDIKMAQIAAYQWLSELDNEKSVEKIMLRDYLSKGLTVMETFADSYEKELCN